MSKLKLFFILLTFTILTNINVVAQSAPVSFNVIGTGSYCTAGGGLNVGLDGSEIGVTYTLYKDNVAQTTTVDGTGAAISFENQTAGSYTVKGTNLNGTTEMNGYAVITIKPAVAITGQLTDGQTITYGGTFAPILVTASGSGLSYEWFSNSTATNSGGTSVGTGSSYTPQSNAIGTLYYYCVVSGECGSQISDISGAFIVNQASQTITFGTLSTKTYGDATFDLTATSSSGLAVTYISSNPSVATISGSTVTIVGAGSTDITASQSGNSNYSAATAVVQTLSVSQASQTITFGTLSTKTYGDATFDLTATSSSGLAVTYISSNPSVATISGSTVTIVGAGSTDITASQSGNSNYSAATSVVQTLSVSQASQTITFGTLSTKTYGDATFGLTATASSGLAVTYISSNPLVATISGSTVTIVGTGSTDITASQSGNSNYSAATSVVQTLSVSQASQTITFGTLSTKTYGDATFGLTATASSGLAVTYISSNPSVATISGSTVTIVGSGSTDITASQSGNSNYSAATSVVQTLSVSQASQTITFGTLSTKTYGDATFGLTAASSSGLAVTYISSNPSVATISGSTVTIVGSGSTDITASQSGNSNYSAATSVVQTLSVSQASQTITFGTLSTKTYGDATFDLTATSSSGLAVTYISSNPSVATISGSTVTIVGAGSTDITASQSGNSNYSAATSVVQTLSVSQASQTITFGTLSTKTYGDATFGLTAASSSGLAVTYISSNPSVATISGSTVTIVGSGSTDITASQSGNTNYGTATDIRQTLTVNKHSQIITFGTLPNLTYGSAPFTLSATGGGSGNPVVFSSSDTNIATCTGNNGSILTIVGAGSCMIYADQAGNSNYSAATQVGRALNGLNAPQTITFGSLASKTYGDASFSLTATSSSGLSVTYTSSDPSVATVSGSTVTIVGAGSTDITASQSGNTNYGAATDIKQTLTINKKNLTIVGVKVSNKAYDGNTTASLSDASLNGVVGSDNVNFTGGIGTFDNKNVGTLKTVTLTGFTLTGTKASNYVLSSQPSSSTANITARPLTITGATAADKTYDGTTSAIITGAVLTGIVGSENVTLINPVAAFTDKNAGTAKAITIAAYTLGGADAGNYTLSEQPSGLTADIIPRAITITADSKSKIYGDADPGFTAQVTTGTIQGTDIASGSLTRAAGETFGNYTINKGTYTYGSNYTETFVNANLTIAKRAITITADVKSKAYGSVDPAFTAQVTVGTIQGTDAASGSLTRVAGEAVGTYAIIKGTYSYGSNYEETFASAAFTITKSEQTITFNALPTRTSIDPDFNLTASASSGLAVTYASSNTAVATISGNTVKIVGAGSTNITASQDGDSNYNAAADVVQNLTIADVPPITLDPINNSTPIEGCESSDIEFAYSGLTGTPTQYKITFSSAATAVGIQNIDYTNLPTASNSGTLSFPIPTGTPEGTYKGTLQFRNASGLESAASEFQFIVNFSSSYIVKKFDDVVLCDNSSNRFVAYQWYKDGVAIPGATKQFYSDPTGLVGLYSVDVTTVDGQKLKTCQKAFNTPLKKNVKAYPNPVQINQGLIIKIDGFEDVELKNAKLTIFDVAGSPVYYSVKLETTNSLSLPPVLGIYVGNVSTAAGANYVFKVVVTK